MSAGADVGGRGSVNGPAEVGSGQDPTDRVRPQAVFQSGEFPLDASVAPGRISCQAQLQVTDFGADGRTAGPVRVGPFRTTRRGARPLTWLG